MSFSLSLEKHPESDLGVSGLDKRAAAADEVNSVNAAGDDIVAAGWLGKGCVAHSVRALRTSEFLFCQREGQQQMKRGAAVH